jgi:hypothetical protein
MPGIIEVAAGDSGHVTVIIRSRRGEEIARFSAIDPEGVENEVIEIAGPHLERWEISLRRNDKLTMRWA